MNTTTTLDELNSLDIDTIGAQLATIREQKGFSIDFVANKLHLRSRIIELIENSDFSLLPEPVFVKGYLRAYSKLLGISPDPFISVFNAQFSVEKKIEKAALWQSKRESHKAEHVIRWFTIVFALGVVVAVGIWWQKNQETNAAYTPKEVTTDLSLNQASAELKLTDLSKMHSLLTPDAQMSLLEKEGG